MDQEKVSRRRFISRFPLGLGSAWLTANWPAILSAQEHAQHAVQSGLAAQFEFFTPEQARVVEAITAQIIPSNDSPGAREAGAVYFIDRALMTFSSDKQKQVADGFGELAAQMEVIFPELESFTEASDVEQIDVLHEIEKSEFFAIIRTHTIMGFLCLPERGGNRDYVGWKLIGMEDAHAYAPPFGEYDRNYPGWEATNSEKVKE